MEIIEFIWFPTQYIHLEIYEATYFIQGYSFSQNLICMDFMTLKFRWGVVVIPWKLLREVFDKDKSEKNLEATI